MLNYARICEGQEHCDVEHPVCYTYSFLPFRHNQRIPESGQLDFYTFEVPIEPPTIAEFELTLISARPMKSDIEAARRSDFAMRRISPTAVKLALLHPLQGPQEVELEITTKMYKDGRYIGNTKAEIKIYVSEYDF